MGKVFDVKRLASSFISLVNALATVPSAEISFPATSNAPQSCPFQRIKVKTLSDNFENFGKTQGRNVTGKKNVLIHLQH